MPPVTEMGDIQRQIIKRGANEAGACSGDASAEPTHCCTFEAQNIDGAPVWIQVLTGTVNMHYPFATDPVEQLRTGGVQIPNGLELLEWEANSFATFSLSRISADELASFVDQLFTEVLGCDDAAYQPRAVIEALDS